MQDALGTQLLFWPTGGAGRKPLPTAAQRRCWNTERVRCAANHTSRRRDQSREREYLEVELLDGSPSGHQTARASPPLELGHIVGQLEALDSNARVGSRLPIGNCGQNDVTTKAPRCRGKRDLLGCWWCGLRVETRAAVETTAKTSHGVMSQSLDSLFQ